LQHDAGEKVGEDDKDSRLLCEINQRIGEKVGKAQLLLIFC
jgi:hypothetical protein